MILFSGFLKNKSEKIKEAMITINNQFRSYYLFFLCVGRVFHHAYWLTFLSFLCICVDRSKELSNKKVMIYEIICMHVRSLWFKLLLGEKQCNLWFSWGSV